MKCVQIRTRKNSAFGNFSRSGRTDILFSSGRDFKGHLDSPKQVPSQLLQSISQTILFLSSVTTQLIYGSSLWKVLSV